MIDPKHTQRVSTPSSKDQAPKARATGQVVPFRLEASQRLAQTLTFSWDDLQHQLTELAVTERQRGLVPSLISATRKQAPFKPPQMVLREVLCIASVLMDETFHPDLSRLDPEEGGMT